MAFAIKAEDVSKAYQLGSLGTGTFSRDLERWISRIRGKEDPFLKIGEVNDRTIKGESDIVWSLQNVSFEIKQGEAIGIIGANGAGKSTLLKILSRVTTPTSGRIIGTGRIASLLEIGTGFHPELSGMENIYLNGTIQGMTKREIKDKLDEIIAFSGVERYINTPVKRYSSGMYVRLAFAVAAHLEAEILIVDEVLAVGDAEFQKKCLGKMNEVTHSGRTLIFVSHNMAAVRNLCTRGILLQKGAILKEGSPEEIITTYTDFNYGGSKAEINWQLDEAPGTERVRMVGARILNNQNIFSRFLADNEDFIIEIDFTTFKDGLYLTPNIQLFDATGTFVLSSGNWASVTTGQDPYSNRSYPKGTFRSRVKLPSYFLNEGMYTVNVLINIDVSIVEVIIKEVLSFVIMDSGDMKKEYMDTLAGVIRPRLEWKTIEA